MRAGAELECEGAIHHGACCLRGMLRCDGRPPVGVFSAQLGACGNPLLQPGARRPSRRAPRAVSRSSPCCRTRAWTTGLSTCALPRTRPSCACSLPSARCGAGAMRPLGEQGSQGCTHGGAWSLPPAPARACSGHALATRAPERLGHTQIYRDTLLGKGFIEIHTPKLQAGASEGGAAVFKLDYMGQPACLAQVRWAVGRGDSGLCV